VVPRGDVTTLLAAWGTGGHAEEQLFELIEPELLTLARTAIAGRVGFARRFEPCELVSETYIRLKHYLGSDRDVSFENRRRFYAMVLKVMRNLLLDAVKKGGKSKPDTTLILPLTTQIGMAEGSQAVDVMAFYEALDRLRKKNEQQAAAIEHHYITGWTLDESAELMGLSTATLKRQLAAARQWFEVQLQNAGA
jgi:RNA polymerase sigma factor (TIGR02999 family)